MKRLFFILGLAVSIGLSAQITELTHNTYGSQVKDRENTNFGNLQDSLDAVAAALGGASGSYDTTYLYGTKLDGMSDSILVNNTMLQDSLGWVNGVLYKTSTSIYYVSNNGNNSNTGLTPESPWKTLDKVNATAFNPGDKILFKRGDTFRGQLKPSVDGASGNHIVFSSYGTGELPIITAMNYHGNNLTWVDRGSSRYAAYINPSLYLKNVSEDGVPLKRMTAAAVDGELSAITGNNQWLEKRAVDTVYIQTRTGVSPVGLNIELGDRFAAYNNGSDEISAADSVDYITIEYIHFQGGYYAVELLGDYLIVQNCKVSNCYSDAIKIEGSQPTNVDDPRGTFPQVAVDIQLLNNDIFNFGESGIDNTGGYNVTIKGNSIHDGTAVRGNFTDTVYNNGILFKNNAINCIVENNHIYDMEVAFGAISIGGATWGGINDETDSCRVSYNLIENVETIDRAANGSPTYMISMTGAKNTTFVNNTITNCSVYETSHISALIYFDLSKSGEATYLTYKPTIKNNILFNNTVNGDKIISESASGDVSDLVMNYNLYDTGTNIFTYTGSTYNSVTLFKVAGFESNSVEDDPDFNIAEPHYSLKTGSPAIDAAEDIDLTSDIDGNTVGASPDIGAYEKQ